MKKLLFFDIDGTLIGDRAHGHRMPESTGKAIELARQNGHVCMVNTGRTDRLVRNWLPDLLEFDGYLMGCGTMIVYGDDVLLHHTFDARTAERIIDGLDRYHIDALLEGQDNLFVREPETMYTKTFRDYIMAFKDKRFGEFGEAPGHFDKFFCYADERESVEDFMAEFGNVLDAIDREGGFFEIVPKGVSKASGMRYMAEYLGIPMEDTVAIGDSNNDLPMLEAAGCAIAMGNSSKPVLDIADYVTAAVEEDGIRKALEWLGVI